MNQQEHAKTFKTIEEQVNYLVEKKNLVYSNTIADVLIERSYISLINPYKRLFSKGETDNGHVYDREIPFEWYIGNAAIDDFCSSEISKWISIFEKRLKFALAYEISKQLNQNNDPEGTSYIEAFEKFFNEKDSKHLTPLGFLSIDKELKSKGLEEANQYHQDQRNTVLTRILNIGSSHKKSKNTLIDFYQGKYERVPFWVMVHTLTFGDHQIILNMMNKQIKSKIYKYFINQEKPVSLKHLNRFSGYVETIRRMRNIISHNEPIFMWINQQRNHDQMLKSIELLYNNYSQSIIASSVIPAGVCSIQTEYNNSYYQKVSDVYSYIKKSKRSNPL